MPPATSHCRTQQCMDSAQMMCDHEAVLSMQYELDQLKIALTKFYPQDYARKERMGMLYFDQGMFSHEFDKKLCGNQLRQQDQQNIKPRLQEQYVPACMRASYKNNLVQTPHVTCSYSHQMFGNHSRAGTGRVP